MVKFRAKEWLVALTVSLGAALTFVEVVFRCGLLPMPIVYESYHFSDEPSHFRNQYTSFGYTPHSTTREVVLHATLTDVVQEYDVTFQANNVGLVQRQDIHKTRGYTVVVGDSFAQGLGARPWFYDLEAQLPDLALANLGIEGTGVSHWVRGLEWFARSAAPVKNVVVLFITDDFLRPYWQAHLTEDGVSFCDVKSCRLVTTKYRPVAPQILFQARHELNAPASWTMRWAKERLSVTLSQSYVGALTIYLRRMFLLYLSHDDTLLEQNKSRFVELTKHNHVLFTLHLPQKEEVAAGRWSTESLSLRQFVEATGVRTIDGMARCGLTIDGFHARDPHPNESGYAHIEQCLAGLLREDLTVAAGTALKPQGAVRNVSFRTGPTN